MNWTEIDCISEVEAAAKESVEPSIWAYVNGGAGANKTVFENLRAFDEFRLVPRIRQEAQEFVDTSISLFGQTLSVPILLAPTSPQRLLHPEADLATARSACSFGTVSIVSSDSHFPFGQIQTNSGGSSWFQLYGYGSQRDIESLLDLVSTAGAKALVVTMDASYPARRLTAKRAGFTLPDYVDFGILREAGIRVDGRSKEGRLPRVPLTWNHLSWIRSRVEMPMLVKGILSAEDARRCVEIGADGIIVSNHGGRQLDDEISSLEALGPVASMVGGSCKVLFDGGVRSGVDVVKTLAQGADAVCIGRPHLWGLALDGEAGVSGVLGLFQRQLEDTLRQLGINSISEISAELVTSPSKRLPAPVNPMVRRRQIA
jgi:4-hydroxymandelate oxidase